MKQWRRSAAVVALLVGAALVTAAASARPSATTKQRSCSFRLRIGDVLPLTGGLAAYGPNLDRAARLAVALDNATLKKLGLARKMSVKLVDTEDGQTQACASVEFRATHTAHRPDLGLLAGCCLEACCCDLGSSVTSDAAGMVLDRRRADSL